MRYLWAGPSTLLGLALASLALRGGRIFVVDGVVEAHGPWLEWALARLVPLRGGASAITFGHVVLGRDAPTLAATRSHERVHVAQYERWGPFFIPAYLLSSAWACARGGHPYFDNPFEQEGRESARGHANYPRDANPREFTRIRPRDANHRDERESPTASRDANQRGTSRRRGYRLFWVSIGFSDAGPVR